MAKETIAVLFGGQSSEHEVSCMSAANVIDQIDRSKYDLILVGITQKGHWVKVDSVEDIRSGKWRESRVGATLSPDASEKCLIIHESSAMIKVKVDLVFPVLHGLWGEDGTVQGLCRLAEIPYAGCGVAASAVCMDKGFTKQIVSHLGIRQAAWELITAEDMQDMVKVVKRVENRFSYPVFVKPCNAGSSCGVVKAHDRDELALAFREAARYDRRILVEETIVGREIECAVLGAEKCRSRPAVSERSLPRRISTIMRRSISTQSQRPWWTRSCRGIPRSVCGKPQCVFLRLSTDLACPEWISL